MKIVHLFAQDRGGAANAAYRLHRGMLAAGLDSLMVVAKKTLDDDTLLQVPGLLHRLTRVVGLRLQYACARMLCPRARILWLPANIPGCALQFAERFKPDIIHLHWVRNGMVSLEQIGRIPHPTVWTLHDLEPLSPGYCYRIEVTEDIRPYQAMMPLLGPYRRLAENVWRRKLNAWRNSDLTIVGPSRWMAEEARRSPVFSGHEVEHIPYIVPLDVFAPAVDRKAARRKLGLPLDRPVILFGVDEIAAGRKGIDLLAAAIRKLTVKQPNLCLAVFGGFSTPWLAEDRTQVVLLGRIDDPQLLAAAYGAADVYVSPSREDNLPNTVLESLACGTPVVSFEIGGMPDMITSGVNGYLAKPFDPSALAEGIALVLKEPSDRFRREARAAAERKFSVEAVVPQYLSLYEKILARQGAR